MTPSGHCYRPLASVLGDAAYCNVCGAERGEPCRLDPAGDMHEPYPADRPDDATDHLPDP